MTVRTRKNAANGGQSTSVGAGTTGFFEDTSGTDTIAAGDKVNVQTVPPATGTFTITNASFLFDATTDSVSILCISDPANGTNFATASTTNYCLPAGFMQFSTTEASNKLRQREAGTMKNMAVNILTNARTTDTIFRSRKNGANGNMTITYTSGQTGFKEDTTNTDTIAVGDDYNYSITTSTGTQIIDIASIKTEFVSTANIGQIAGGWVGGVIIADPTTTQISLAGDMTVSTTETFTQIETREAFTFSELTIFVSLNDVSTASTCRLRKNAANGNQVASITGNTTGAFTDTTNTDVCVASDLVNYQIIVPSVSGSHSITIVSTTMYSLITVAGNNITKTMPTETTTISETSNTLLRNKIRTRSETITVSD